MEAIKNKIKEVEQNYTKALQEATTEHDLEQIRIAYLGRSSHLTELMAQMKQLDTQDKRVVGPLLNKLKQSIQEAYEEKKQTLANQKNVHATEKKKTL